MNAADHLENNPNAGPLENLPNRSSNNMSKQINDYRNDSRGRNSNRKQNNRRDEENNGLGNRRRSRDDDDYSE